MHILFHQENQIDSFKYNLLINSIINGMEELVESINFTQNLPVYSFAAHRCWDRLVEISKITKTTKSVLKEFPYSFF